MQQAWKKWIIIVSVVLVAALFFLFIPYGKDAAAYRLTKKYISRYYYQKPSSVVVRGGTVGANNDCVWIRLEINGYPERLWIDEDGSALPSGFGAGTDSWFNSTKDFNVRKVNRLLWLSYH